MIYKVKGLLRKIEVTSLVSDFDIKNIDDLYEFRQFIDAMRFDINSSYVNNTTKITYNASQKIITMNLNGHSADLELLEKETWLYMIQVFEVLYRKTEEWLDSTIAG